MEAGTVQTMNRLAEHVALMVEVGVTNRKTFSIRWLGDLVAVDTSDISKIIFFEVRFCRPSGRLALWAWMLEMPSDGAGIHPSLFACPR
jgi:hypothetical protein